MQPSLHFKDLTLPSLPQEEKLFDCLTTPAPTNAGRSPRAKTFKINEASQLRWTRDHKIFPPFQHYSEKYLVYDSESNWDVAPARLRERMMGFDGEFTPVMGSEHREYQRNKALGNAWHFPSASWLLLLVLLSTIPSSISSPPSQLNVDTVVQLWHCHHVLFGLPPREHNRQYMPQVDWMSHLAFAQRLETSCTPKPLDPTLAWCIEFQHHFRKGIIHELRMLVDDMSEDTQQWFDRLPDHVKMAYQGEHGITQIPVLLHLLKMIGYPQLDILRRELSSDFPLLGKLTPGVSWYIRTDDKYTSPSSIDELRQRNHEYVLKKLEEARVDGHDEFMLDEIISEVNIGRMNGPFEAPAEWRIKCVRHLTLLPIPHEFPIIAVAFSIEQIGSDMARERFDEAKTGEGADTTERA